MCVANKRVKQLTNYWKKFLLNVPWGRDQTVSVYGGRFKTEGCYGGRFQSRPLWGPFSDPVGAVFKFIHMRAYA